MFCGIMFIQLFQKHDEEYEEPHDYNKNSVNVKDGAGGGFAFNPSAVAGGGGGGLGTGEQNPDIKAHHLLVLLLRLRQVQQPSHVFSPFLCN